MSQSESLDETKTQSSMATATARKPNTALKKGLSALEFFAAQTRPVASTVAAFELGLSPQATLRLLRQLEDLGLIQRLPDDKFILGPRSNKLAIDIISTSHISASTHAILESVVSLVGETSNIGILDGYEVVYIDRVECNWPLRAQLRPGSRVPSHCTALGKLLLAHLPSRRRARLVSLMPLPRITEYTITSRQAFTEHLKEIRSQGYSINNQEDSLGLIALAVPIRSRSNTVVAGLSIHSPEARLPIEQAKTHIDELNAAAAQLSKVFEF